MPAIQSKKRSALSCVISFLMMMCGVRLSASVYSCVPDSLIIDPHECGLEIERFEMSHDFPATIYDKPYSVNGCEHDWHRLWVNTGVLGGAFVGTLLVLECLPEDATSWNRAEIQSVAPFKRWYRNIFKKGPEWDSDKFYFNYILHPYAGAVYYMGARSCGFNAWQSLLYCTCISTVFWEFGIEAFMERPSIQDLFITPLVGGIIGEGFYKIKRTIVDNGYRLAGSSILGNVVVFLVDPINEVIGLFAGNDCRRKVRTAADSGLTSSFVLQPAAGGVSLGVSLRLTF